MCTSFASYYDNPLYGYNFDFPDVEMKVKIEKTELTKYICFYLNAYGVYYPFVGMNLKGKFVNFQEMHVLDNEATEKPKAEIDAVELFFNYLQDRVPMDQIESIKSDITLTYPAMFKVHNMFADLDEKAVILECLKGKAVQRKINGKKMVMTNFSNVKYSDDNNINPQCIGVDRYLTANRMLEEEKDLLDIGKAINVLRSTFQTEGDYQTRSSFVFNPLKNEIYMIIARDTDNVWKISLEDETLDKVGGYNNKIAIKNEGLVINKLI